MARRAHFSDQHRYMAKFMFFTASLPPAGGGGKYYSIAISVSVNSRNETLYIITLHSNEMRERQMPTATCTNSPLNDNDDSS